MTQFQALRGGISALTSQPNGDKQRNSTVPPTCQDTRHQTLQSSVNAYRVSSCNKVLSSVSVQGLAQLEILCKQLYETTDTAVRHQAEKALVEFTNSPDCLSKCQLLLERGSVSAQPHSPNNIFLSLFVA